MNKNKLFVMFLLLANTSWASIKLPNLVGNNMVLQRDKPIKIWGYGNPNEKVTIVFGDKTIKTTTGNAGKWQTTLPKMAAGGPYEMVLEGENKITLSNILIGDVWICSGQSNMEFNLNDVMNADQELKEANIPQIRLYSVNKAISLKPKEDSKGNWVNCTPEQAKYFAAVGYFFGKRIHHDLKIPIGLINASWGGTVIESWISREGLSGEEIFEKKAEQVAGFDTVAYNVKQRGLNNKWVSHFNNQDEGFKNGQYTWANVNTADWKTINLPTAWEFTRKPDLWELDGVVWFSKKITLSDADLTQDARLSLGVILNADRAFFNGEQVGKTADSWGVLRNYNIPKLILKKGENTITVRVENYGGDGGFMSNAAIFNFKSAAQQISLTGEWNYKIGYKLSTYDRPEKEISPNTLPTLMYNNMISPLTGISIKGFLWYQGEANWGRGYQYRELFPRMIADWRNKFKDKDLPFLYVQLANYQKEEEDPGDSYLAEVREAQALTQSVKNTGMITAVDLGDAANIHPKNKQEVGRRLALLAEKIVYKLPVDSLSTDFEHFTVKDNAVFITVKNAYDGLRAKSNTINGFQIAGEDKVWQWADASFTGINTIKVSSEKVKKPVAVRYAWANNPEKANVINSKGLPLLPFRTDDWKGLSFGAK